MNYRTTFILLIFVALAATGFYFGPKFVPGLPWAPAESSGADSGSASLVKNDLASDKVTRITLHSGDE